MSLSCSRRGLARRWRDGEMGVGGRGKTYARGRRGRRALAVP